MNRTLLVLLSAGAAIASAEDVFVAVGAGGHRMTSRDGKTWENHAEWGKPAHDNNDLNVVAIFKGTAFVGGGYNYARLCATRDGKAWSDGRLASGGPVFGFEEVDGTLYAVTLRGHVHKTVDGKTWSKVGAAEMPTPTHWIRTTASGNGLVVGSGDFGPVLALDTKTGKITVTQMDGQKDKNAGFHRVAFGNGVFVVGGQDGLLAVSRDGLAWDANKVMPDRGDIRSVVFADGRFLAAATKGTFVSKDGKAWEAIKADIPKTLRTAGGRVFGWNWPPNKFRVSRDGLKWEDVDNAKGWYVKDFAFGSLAGDGPPAVPTK